LLGSDPQILDIKSIKKSEKLSPIVKSLTGSLKDADLDEPDYKIYLEDKYL